MNLSMSSSSDCGAWGEDDTDGQDVEHLLKGDVLVLHLAPNGVRRLDALLDVILDAHLVERLLDGCGELREQLMTRGLCRSEFLLDDLILLRVLVAEAEVFKLALNLVESQAVGQGGVDVKRLTRYLILFVGGLALQGTHIVKSVADFDENHADVIAHGEQQLLEVLGLRRCLFTEDAT